MARDCQLILRFEESSPWTVLDFFQQMSEAISHAYDTQVSPPVVATTFDYVLFTLWLGKTISVEEALERAEYPDDLAQRILVQKRPDLAKQVFIKEGSIFDFEYLGSGDQATVDLEIYTGDPLATFTACRPMLERHRLMQHLCAAWSKFSEQKYTVIWPDDYVGEFRA